MTLNEWEVWYAKVKFDDDWTQIKERPVLVISKELYYVLSLKITSHSPRANFPGEYSLVKWQEAGLHKQSTVRTSKKLKLVESDFVHKIGRLHPVDILGIRQLLSDNNGN